MIPKSYAQDFEDILILLCIRDRKDISYLDIGCNHPIRWSNTYLFYENGYRGTLVEPLTDLHELIQKLRPEDHLIKYGVGDGTRSEYLIKIKGSYGTSSYITDDKYKGCANCHTIKVLTINEILMSIKKLPTFISIDCEGYDLPILKTMDFEKYPVPVICAETNKPVSIKGMDEFMASKGYSMRFKNCTNTVYGK